MTTATQISEECKRGEHREKCSNPPSCNCECHDPLRPKIDLDEESRRREERPEEYVTKVSNV